MNVAFWKPPPLCVNLVTPQAAAPTLLVVVVLVGVDVVGAGVVVVVPVDCPVEFVLFGAAVAACVTTFQRANTRRLRVSEGREGGPVPVYAQG